MAAERRLAAVVIVVDGSVNNEKLGILLDEGHEQEQLDYKQSCDPAHTQDLVELAKDVGAMQAMGGYIVVGADSRGTPSGGLTAKQVALYDESRLRPMLARYLPEPVRLRTACHEMAGITLAVICVMPHPHGFVIFKAPGNYEVSAGKQKTVFRQGEVFVRHGTSSERWRQADIDGIFDRVTESRKEDWRRLYAQDVRDAAAGAAAQESARLPAETLRWNLDRETLRRIVVEQLRVGDEYPLRLLLEGVVPAFEAGIASSDADDQRDALAVVDRLLCLMATLDLLGRSDLLDRCLSWLFSVYQRGFLDPTVGTQRPGAPALWFGIVSRILALGGLLVRRRRWQLVAQLATKRGEGGDWDHFANWLRHGQVEGARRNFMHPDSPGNGSLISLAVALVNEDECLRPDLPVEDDAILTSICQFDALAGLAATGATSRPPRDAFYPNFARFQSRRVIGIL